MSEVLVTTWSLAVLSDEHPVIIGPTKRMRTKQIEIKRNFFKNINSLRSSVLIIIAANCNIRRKNILGGLTYLIYNFYKAHS